MTYMSLFKSNGIGLKSVVILVISLLTIKYSNGECGVGDELCPRIQNVCDQTPCVCTEDQVLNCKMETCHANGCDQCENGYWKQDYNIGCVQCQEVFGDDCMHCTDFLGCQQCSPPSIRTFDSDCGVWYCTNDATCITPRPTNNPTPRPTNNPTAPTQSPTDKPTLSPSDRPTDSPTNKPTPSPTDPTSSPTDKPTDSPTNKPTSSPTDRPTSSPTDKPTDSPTDRPTSSPSDKPTSSPIDRVTLSPTYEPTPSLTPPNLCGCSGIEYVRIRYVDYTTRNPVTHTDYNELIGIYLPTNVLSADGIPIYELNDGSGIIFYKSNSGEWIFEGITVTYTLRSGYTFYEVVNNTWWLEGGWDHNNPDPSKSTDSVFPRFCYCPEELETTTITPQNNDDECDNEKDSYFEISSVSDNNYNELLGIFIYYNTTSIATIDNIPPYIKQDNMNIFGYKLNDNSYIIQSDDTGNLYTISGINNLIDLVGTNTWSVNGANEDEIEININIYNCDNIQLFVTTNDCINDCFTISNFELSNDPMSTYPGGINAFNGEYCWDDSESLYIYYDNINNYRIEFNIVDINGDQYLQFYYVDVANPGITEFSLTYDIIFDENLYGNEFACQDIIDEFFNNNPTGTWNPEHITDETFSVTIITDPIITYNDCIGADFWCGIEPQNVSKSINKKSFVNIYQSLFLTFLFFITIIFL